jgi:prepilin-type N-terminal cleavage/methylation domain-containing protein
MRRRGFTLIELLVVIAIMAVLMPHKRQSQSWALAIGTA